MELTSFLLLRIYCRTETHFDIINNKQYENEYVNNIAASLLSYLHYHLKKWGKGFQTMKNTDRMIPVGMNLNGRST